MSRDTLHHLIDTALAHGASDLLLMEGRRPRLKVSGQTQELETSVVTRADLMTLWTACGADPLTTSDVDAAYMRSDRQRLRVNLLKQLTGLGAILRPIRYDIPPLASLGLPTEVITPWLLRKHGLILVTGATGAGKSTSIAACLDWLNDHVQKHVISIEDPVEYLFDSRSCLFTQREVGTDTTSFPHGLRGALRQAPDVIFIGEIRDAETATTALHACETGHLVVSTLHSADAVETIERMVNLFPLADRTNNLMLLSTQLVGILSQMLLPTKGGGAMTPICEFMENQGAIRQWIRTEKLAEIRDYMKRPQSEGCQPFLAALISAVQSHVIDYEVAHRATTNPTDFERALHGLT